MTYLVQLSLVPPLQRWSIVKISIHFLLLKYLLIWQRTALRLDRGRNFLAPKLLSLNLAVSFVYYCRIVKDVTFPIVQLLLSAL